MKSAFNLGLALTLLAAPCVAPAQQPDQATKAVLALDSVWARNYATHDTATALKLMAPDFVMTSTNGAIKDRNAELADVRPFAGTKVNYFRTEGARARVYGNAAVVTGVLAWETESNGQKSPVRRRYTATYVRGGPLGFQMVALHVGRAE